MAYRAKTSFGWGQRIVHEDDVVPDDDPVLVKHRDLFDPIGQPTVEQATAAPGERRRITRPKKEPARG